MIQGYDLFMLLVLAAAVLWGAWKGLAWQLASLASVILSYIVAIYFRQPLAGILKQNVELAAPLDTGLAMLILFLGTSLVVWVGFNLVSEAIERVKLKEFDRQVGALLGLAKGVLLCVVITLIGVTISDSLRGAIHQSRSGYYIAQLLDQANAYLPSEVNERLHPFEQQLKENVTVPTNLLSGDEEGDIYQPRVRSGYGSSYDDRYESSQDPETAGRDRPQFNPSPRDDWRR